MSLIVEALKKLKNRNSSDEKQSLETLPPGINPDEKTQKFSFSRKFIFISLLGIAILGAFAILGFVYFINNNYGKLPVVNKQNKQMIVNHNVDNINKRELKQDIRQQDIKPIKNKKNQNVEEKQELKEITEEIQVAKEKTPEDIQKPKEKEVLFKETKEGKEPPIIKISNTDRVNSSEKSKANPLQQLQLRYEDFNKLVLLADYYLDKGDLIEALNLYEKAFSLKKDNYVLDKLMYIYIQTGQTNRITKFIDYIRQNQNLAKNIAVKLIKTGYLEFANDFIRNNILNIADKNLLMGMLYETKGNINKSLTFYKKAFSFNKKPIYVYAYGRVLEIKGNYNEALKIYKKAKRNNDKFYKLIQERVKFLEGL